MNFCCEKWSNAYVDPLLTLFQVDIDEFSELALDYDVASVPVLLVIKDGKVQKRLVGLQDTDKLRSWVESAVK